MTPQRFRGLAQLIWFLVLAGVAPTTMQAATLPAGFSETLVAQGLSRPTAMQFAPDGRLFVCEQGGRLRVIDNGVLLTTPFVSVTVDSAGGRGLLGMAFDPNFATNQFVYVYYTATTPTVHNRISRFVANGTIAVPGSETIIFELDDLSGALINNGGALSFGHDGKLYAAVGDTLNGANAQSLNNLFGKMLRINSDGTIPFDNPFFSQTAGRNRAIWALGLRNPAAVAFNPTGNELFINDVGQNAWEEINNGIAGANYGWPDTEGATSDPRVQSPRYAYAHYDGHCAITGGAFYSPPIQFPSDYAQDYFFADSCSGWIRKLDPYTGNTIAAFATGISVPVDLKVAGDGALYYLARGRGTSTGEVYRVEWVGEAGNQTPTAAITQPTDGTLYKGGDVITYAGTGSDPEDGTLPPNAFTWRVDFHHVLRADPFISPTTGSKSGSFRIPTRGETFTQEVWYRIHLTVRDSGGKTHSVYTDIRPQTVRLTLATSPAGLKLKLDEQPTGTTISFDAVVGMTRTLEAISPQASGGATFSFLSWSDGGAVQHEITTPATNTTFTATYGLTGSRGTGMGLEALYFSNIDFTGDSHGLVDPTVDFRWGAGAPAHGWEPDTFSARWFGQVEAEVTGTYTFYTQSDDGVRLSVNGQLLVDNWTDHGTTENSGNIALVAGQRYQIRMEYYENTGDATARLLWSSPSRPKEVVPSTRLYSPAATAIGINFQPPFADTPAGYLPDTGLAFGSRNNGQTYGWNADNTAQMRDRNAANSRDQRFDTLAYMQRPGNPDAFWEIAVPNGTYEVEVMAGDPSFFGSTLSIAAEGVLIVSHVTTSAGRWRAGRSMVTVRDGRLTIHNAPGADGNKICFLEIRQVVSDIKINFQPDAAPRVSWHLTDLGPAFGIHDLGLAYGWNADNTAQMRDRNAANSPDQRHDTFAYMQRPENPDATWEIALQNGSYWIRVVAGDPSFFGNRLAIAVEDVVVVSGTTTTTQRWLEGIATVTVADGRLTIHNAPGADGNKLCFIEIKQW
jgi:glucose/arabinose dehydrogenase